MTKSQQEFSLQQGQSLYTPSREDAYLVLQGSVYVYLLPLGESGALRRLFLGEFKAGEAFPGFVWKDHEGKNWVFLILARAETKIRSLSGANTRVLQRHFCQVCQVAKFETEGFYHALIDHYQRKILVPEKGLLEKNRQASERASQEIRSTLGAVFGVGDELEAVQGKDDLYAAVYTLCKESKIPCISYDKLREAMGYKKAKVEDIARCSNFACREIVLEEGWEATDAGPIIAFSSEGRSPVACIPRGSHKYVLYDPASGEKRALTADLAATLDLKAYGLYRPLASQPLSRKDIWSFIKQSIKARDLAWAAGLALAISLINLLVPALNQAIYDRYIPLSNFTWVLEVGLLVGCFMLGNVAFSIVKALSLSRIYSHITNDLQSAMFARIFKLPQSVLESMESGDLTQRVASISSIASSLSKSIFSSLFSAAFNLIFLVQLFIFSPRLALVGLGLLLVYMLISVPIFLSTQKHERQVVSLDAQMSARLQQYLGGMAKLRMAGAEKRALLQYLKPYAAKQEVLIKEKKLSALGDSLDLIIANLFTLCIYAILIKGQLALSFGSYMAFSAAFGTVCATAMSVLGSWKEYFAVKPSLKLLSPLLENSPEVDEAMEMPSELSGRIEVRNLSFRYGTEGPLVLNNLSLTVGAGEYLAIVGASGCGKSTLLKLLLGFEQPIQGKIYYDNMDLAQVNKQELRKKMGVVLQNDSTISGSIIDNIRLTYPEASYEQVMATVEAVGLTDDIKEMPMGIRTMLSERGDTISGGQKQRITIARAIISQPAILFFDEATSALDNVTQDKVINTLDNLAATRIVIAHRLSTILKCDRIIVMDQGRIVESGSYEELMAKQGLFYDLATRQIA